MRTLMVVLMSVLALGLWPAVIIAQDAPAAPDGSPIQQETPVPPSTTPGTGTPTDQPPDTTTTSTGPEQVQQEEQQQSEVDAGDRPAWQAPGYGNAANRSNDAKVAEAVGDCDSGRDPVSRMLAVGGTSTGTGNRPWVVLALLVALAALAVALGAWLLRHRRGQAEGQTRPPRGPLETVATILGIVTAIFGLAVAVSPDIAPDKSSSESATMAVRDVDARIRHGEYARKTGSGVPLKRIDRSEIGNVVWLQVGLKGYKGKRAVVQFGLHDPARGGALLDGTEKQVVLREPSSQDETLFVPIWVGYPRTGRFEAHFRLVEDNEVRQIASTGRMRASQYRYACEGIVKRLAGG
jgi:hypothetical protein